MLVVTYQNRSFSWTNNKMGSEVEKIVQAHFSLRWAVLRAHFKISIQILVVTDQNRSFSWTIRSGKNCSRSLLDHQWYIEAVGLMWVFLELLVVTVLSVSHMVAFIRVLFSLLIAASLSILPYVVVSVIVRQYLDCPRTVLF